MTISLKIEKIFDDLDTYLKESQLYDVKESNYDQVNATILSEFW